MSIASFEKVSISEANKAGISFEDMASLKLPTRSTSGSAGYDFYIPYSATLDPGQLLTIPTGIRCKIDNGYVLQLYPRSSLGFRYGLQLVNTVGIIDSDYYNADNEGHIFVKLINTGSEQFTLIKGYRFIQGVFLKFFTANEDKVVKERTGGIGSTNK